MALAYTYVLGCRVATGYERWHWQSIRGIDLWMQRNTRHARRDDGQWIETHAQTHAFIHALTHAFTHESPTTTKTEVALMDAKKKAALLAAWRGVVVNETRVVGS